jgi:hypothetical protein
LGSIASGCDWAKARSVAKLATTTMHVQNIVVHFTIAANFIFNLFSYFLLPGKRCVLTFVSLSQKIRKIEDTEVLRVAMFRLE